MSEINTYIQITAKGENCRKDVINAFQICLGEDIDLCDGFFESDWFEMEENELDDEDSYVLNINIFSYTEDDLKRIVVNLVDEMKNVNFSIIGSVCYEDAGEFTRVFYLYDGTTLTYQHMYDSMEAHYKHYKKEDCEDAKFVVTGKLNYFDNREELVEYIEDRGGCVVGSVTSSVDYLICNNSDSKTTITTKARELDVEIITELEFLKKFAEDLNNFGIEEDEGETSDDDFGEDIYDISLFEMAEKKNGTSIVKEIWEDGHWVKLDTPKEI